MEVCKRPQPDETLESRDLLQLWLVSSNLDGPVVRQSLTRWSALWTVHVVCVEKSDILGSINACAAHLIKFSKITPNEVSGVSMVHETIPSKRREQNALTSLNTLCESPCNTLTHSISEANNNRSVNDSTTNFIHSANYKRKQTKNMPKLPQLTDVMQWVWVYAYNTMLSYLHSLVDRYKNKGEMILSKLNLSRFVYHVLSC